MNPRHAISTLAVIAGTALLAGCGGGGEPAASAQHSGGSAASSTRVTISDFKFSPASDTVMPGAGLSVTNQDGTAHTMTADDGHSFDTGTLAPGASKPIPVRKPGRYPYHCDIHSFMHGTLIVK